MKSSRLAVVTPNGRHTLLEMMTLSSLAASTLPKPGSSLEGCRVAFLAPAGVEFVATLQGIWRAGAVAVPLCPTHPVPELAHVIRDCGAGLLVVHPEFESRLRTLADESALPLVSTAGWTGPAEPDRSTAPEILPVETPDQPALILYTSGTTGKPKGAVLSHAAVAAQVDLLLRAWGWTENDRILHVLPLHHTHGLINALLCSLAAGACCEFQSPFDPAAAWERLASGDITLFMAVPTIYHRLIEHWGQQDEAQRRRLSDGIRGLRLMVSGSAALPVPTFLEWERIAGHRLLERYGMTEIGMVLSNPLAGERRPGTVGQALPGVQVRLVDEAGRNVPAGTPGELWVRTPGMFSGYWGRLVDSEQSFTDGWFRTGDLAVVEDGYHRILGRLSTDILKTGGYKVSALEIEAVLREHPDVADCAVVGLPDPEWGERVAAAVVLRVGPGDRVGLSAKAPPPTLTLDGLRAWARGQLAPYKLPARLAVVPTLPRNPMGKVVKAEVRRLFA
jgi:malonyl-CoA/methylmalonyl-CoA synthetase